MSKEEIIKKIEHGICWEDEFIAKYDEESVWTLLRDTLNEEKFRKIERLLRENIADTRKHKKILEDLTNRIRSGEYEI